jgi:hypothetical protein
MRFAGTESWRMSTNRWDNLTDIALWIRATAGIEAAPDRLVPGPLDADDVPAVAGELDPALGPQWSAWWHAMLQDPETMRGGPFPGADGLADAPQLAALVEARWLEAQHWHSARQRRELNPETAVSKVAGEVVREFERDHARTARPFSASFLVVPVRDDTIRRIHGHHYLVPECVYTGRRWRVWLTDLVAKIG